MMTKTTTRLTTVVETYLADLQRIRASGGATGERSSYGPLANLLKVSQPREPPLRLLSEPSVSLSTHWAPIIQPLA